jgi:hypothetical protein
MHPSLYSYIPLFPFIIYLSVVYSTTNGRMSNQWCVGFDAERRDHTLYQGTIPSIRLEVLKKTMKNVKNDGRCYPKFKPGAFRVKMRNFTTWASILDPIPSSTHPQVTCIHPSLPVYWNTWTHPFNLLMYPIFLCPLHELSAFISCQTMKSVPPPPPDNRESVIEK